MTDLRRRPPYCQIGESTRPAAALLEHTDGAWQPIGGELGNISVGPAGIEFDDFEAPSHHRCIEEGDTRINGSDLKPGPGVDRIDFRSAADTRECEFLAGRRDRNGAGRSSFLHP